MSDESAQAIRREVERVLTQGEAVLAVAPQNLVNSPFKKDSAVVTNRRFIIYRPKLLGRMDMEDFLWQDDTEVTIATRLLGATLEVRSQRRGPDGGLRSRAGRVDGLDNRAALRVYAEAQRLEQEWREKNRVRLMEEERARSGGITLQGAAFGGASPPGVSIEERLAKLKALHEKGLVSDAEYEARKSQIIGEL